MGSVTSPSNLKPLADTEIFTPVRIGALNLSHRIVQAPLTRMRGTKESEGVWAPGDINVEYYSQRANKGGFQLTEATNISRLVIHPTSHAQINLLINLQCGGYPGIPGVFTSGQLAGWKRVTDAVHAKGGFIYCQIWHVGRATVPALIEGQTTLSSSDIPIKGKAVNGQEYSDFPPRPATIEEIKGIVENFATAAKRCVEAGFDGVEIHGWVLNVGIMRIE